MKRLYLMRHGKSDWQADYGADHERPLQDRGVQAARMMGQFLTKLGQQPDLVITSSARRAHDTVALAAEAGSWECPTRVTRDFYERGPEEVLQEIQQQADDVERLLVAGHQPTWSQLVGRFVGGCDVRFPTAALARVDFRVERWQQVSFGRGTLFWLVTPKLLARAGADNGARQDSSAA